MNLERLNGLGFLAAFSLCIVAGAYGNEIETQRDNNVLAPFDIVATKVTTQNGYAIFETKVRGDAGKLRPQSTGKFQGSGVYAYVWPTSLNSSDVGFDKDQGIVALALIFHPDFDDAAKGRKNRDHWHAHWVVLTKDKSCGGLLKVRDIPKDAHPQLPDTWPGAAILTDSPDYLTEISGDTVKVRVPLDKIGALKSESFDGVTAALRVNPDLASAPPLCVSYVFKMSSGNLSLPGKVEASK